MIIGTRYSEYYLEYYLLFGILLEYYKKCYSFNPGHGEAIAIVI